MSMADDNPNARLIEAAKAGNEPAIASALAAGADIDYRDDSGWTALMWAAHLLRPKVVKLLVKKGADPSIRDGLNEDAADIAANEYVTHETASSSIRKVIKESKLYQQRQEEMAAIAKSFASALAKDYGGRTKRQGVINIHAAYSVTANYKGMQCIFRVFAGGFDLWIQNIRPGKLYISLNRENHDNASPTKTEGLIPFSELFADDLPIYFFHKEGFAPGAQKFLMDEQNRADLAKVAPGRFEWLVISEGQLRLRTQSMQMDVIRERLDAIAAIFARTNPVLPAPLLERYALKIGKAKDIHQPHHFGGMPGTPIHCLECRAPLGRIAAFDKSDEALRCIKWRDETIEVALCLGCALPETSSLTCISYAAQPPVVLHQSQTFGSGEVAPLTERPLSLVPADGKRLEMNNRVGGLPGWIQADDTPTCPSCNEAMRFFAQFASTGKYMFGADMGIAYVFLCEPCNVVATAIQSC